MELMSNKHLYNEWNSCQIIIYIMNGNKSQRIPKWQSKMDNSEKLATQGTQDEEKQNKHNMCWTPLYTNKHK